MENFKKLGLSDSTIEALKKKGFTEPTSIQSKVIPLLLEGTKDVVGQSQTGTGKTASFALPILEKITHKNSTVQAIVLTPTRELAMQVAKEIDSLKGDKRVEVIPVYGGSPITQQIKKLKEGVDIVVGTPGRVMDLQRRNVLRLDDIKYAVLDEADEMLNMGFVEDIESILKNTPKDKVVLLFSATMPKQIINIAKNYMREYDFIEVEKHNVTLDAIEQIYYDISAKDRIEALKRIFDYYIDFHGIVFCNTRSTVNTLTTQLSKMNYSAAAIHGDIIQSQREKILQQFRDKRVKILIATDVAARGIDVNDLTHVINFSLPKSPEGYVHRIGRTGRAGKKGIAITLVIPSERGKLNFVEKINKCKLIKQKLPSGNEIIEHKETQIKTVIEKIMAANSDKSSKYKTLAEELLKDNDPNEVIAAVLKYSFKNELDSESYKEISEAKSSGRSSSYGGRDGNRRGNRGGDRSGGRSRRSGDRPRFRKRSDGEQSSNRSNSENKEKRFGKSRFKKKPGRNESENGSGKKEKGFGKRGFGRKSDRLN